jgi:hypothetical protein
MRMGEDNIYDAIDRAGLKGNEAEAFVHFYQAMNVIEKVALIVEEVNKRMPILDKENIDKARIILNNMSTEQLAVAMTLSIKDLSKELMNMEMKR